MTVHPPNDKSKSSLGLAIEIEMEKYCLECSFVVFKHVCVLSERGDRFGHKRHLLRLSVGQTNLQTGFYDNTMLIFDSQD